MQYINVKRSFCLNMQFEKRAERIGFWNSYFTCVVYTQKIIHLSASEYLSSSKHFPSYRNTSVSNIHIYIHIYHYITLSLSAISLCYDHDNISRVIETQV